MDLTRSAGLTLLLSILLLASLPARADLCKYRDSDGNIRYSADGAQPGWTVLWCSRPSPSPATPKREKSDASNSAKWVYPDGVTPTFDIEDDASAKNGYKKCEVSIAMVSNSAEEGVDVRVKILSDGKTTQSSITTDVVGFTVSNGIFYDPKRILISNASVISNVFGTTAMTQLDAGDGGRRIMLDRDSFVAMVNLIKRGDFVVGFKRTERAQDTFYVVRNGVGEQVLSKLQACLKHHL